MMNMDVNHFEEVETLFNQGLGLDEIKNHLLQKQFDDEWLEKHLSFAKSLKYRKQRKLGFNLVAIGALLCLSSCILTFFHEYSAVYAAFTLYGLTMIGATVVIIGLAFILGI